MIPSPPKKTAESQRDPLRILVATSFKVLPRYEEMPRGMCAIPYLLEGFGHEVRHVGAQDTLRFWRALRVLKDWRPHVILAHQRASLILGFLRKVRLVKCPIIHAWDDYYAIQHPLPTWLIWPLEVASVRWADYVVAASPYNLHLAKKWGLKCEFIPHGVLAESDPTPLRLESARTKVIYLGTQDRYKGSFELVEAVRNLNCDLFMVGDINHDLRRVAPANVHFVGPVPQPQVRAVLEQADILLNSSNQDSNFKLYDYIRAGKPLLGVKGRSEWLLKNGEEALLVDDIRAGLQQMLGNPELCRMLAANLHKKPIFTWEQIARKHEAALQKLAMQHNASASVTH